MRHVTKVSLVLPIDAQQLLITGKKQYCGLHYLAGTRMLETDIAERDLAGAHIGGRATPA
jgi:hypothetical protein